MKSFFFIDIRFLNFGKPGVAPSKQWWIAPLLAALLGAGCAAAQDNQLDNEPDNEPTAASQTVEQPNQPREEIKPEVTPEVTPEPRLVETPSDKVARMLHGVFNSRKQSESDPSYFNISLIMCRVNAPSYGSTVLYVEQAMASNLSKPYRQRLYVIEPSGDQVISEVWAPVNASQWVGLCAQPAVATIPGDAFNLRDGCGVYLTPSVDGATGGTQGQACASSMNGAQYATAKVSVFEDKITSWDQGFAGNGAQVWGATAGAYVFDRRTQILTAAEFANLLPTVSP